VISGLGLHYIWLFSLGLITICSIVLCLCEVAVVKYFFNFLRDNYDAHETYFVSNTQCYCRFVVECKTGGVENDGHENAGHVSGVWIRPTTLNTVECTVLFQRHLIFLDIHILQIFVDTWYSCVLVLGYAFQLFYNYRRSIQLTALPWLVFCRCFEKNCTLHCNVFSNDILSSNFISVNFMSVIFSQPVKFVPLAASAVNS